MFLPCNWYSHSCICFILSLINFILFFILVVLLLNTFCILLYCVFAIADAYYIKKKHDQVYAIFLVEQVQLALDYVPLICFNIYRHSP